MNLVVAILLSLFMSLCVCLGQSAHEALKAELAEWLKQGRRKCYLQTVKVASPWSLEELNSLAVSHFLLLLLPLCAANQP